MNYLVLLLFTFVLIYLFILTSTYLFQRKLLYHPTENNYSGDQILVKVEKIKVKTEDNIELLSWFHKKNLKKYKTILFLHGNAGTLENRIHKINHFKDMNINFLIVAWRGFSGNEGQPTEKGLYEDGRSAVEWLKTKGVKEENIVIYGESLGTGIAVEIAQNKNFAGIIVESPFTSMGVDFKTKYPYLPVGLLGLHIITKFGFLFFIRFDAFLKSHLKSPSKFALKFFTLAPVRRKANSYSP